MPVILWGADMGIYYNMLHASFGFNNVGAYYLCRGGEWKTMDKDEANKHLTRRFRDIGAIGD